MMLRSSLNHSRRFISTTPATYQNSKSIISKLDILGDSKPPLNNISKCTKRGIIFDSDIIVPHNKTCLLISNSIYELPLSHNLNGPISVEIHQELLNLLRLINPMPELMVIGLGSKNRLLNDSNLNMFKELGIRVEISDTKNACRNFDLLATERPGQVGALLLPMVV